MERSIQMLTFHKVFNLSIPGLFPNWANPYDFSKKIRATSFEIYTSKYGRNWKKKWNSYEKCKNQSQILLIFLRLIKSIFYISKVNIISKKKSRNLKINPGEIRVLFEKTGSGGFLSRIFHKFIWATWNA